MLGKNCKKVGKNLKIKSGSDSVTKVRYRAAVAEEEKMQSLRKILKTLFCDTIHKPLKQYNVFV